MTEDLPESGAEPESSEDDSLEASLWKRYESAMRARLQAATEAAEARRGRSRFIDSGFLILERNRVLPASLLVGAMASRIVIYMVPLLALLVFSFGLYGDVTQESGAETARNVGMASLVAQTVEDTADLSEGVRIAVVLATAYAALYAANTLGRLVRRSSALVWGVPYSKLNRPWKVPLIVIVLTLVGLFLSSLGAVSEEWTVEVFIGALTLEIIGITIFWTLVSLMLPHDPEARRWGDFIPGAIFVALGVVGLRVAMVVYFAPTVDDLTDRYGSIALSLVMLTWAYWLGMIVVGSAEINAALFRSRELRRSTSGS
ncbi:MAG TPA: YhjD/YihY/BrkB family envelope integrity protein [Acidimicrobiia bacterium]